MIYYLYHKELPVIKVDYNKETGKFTKIIEIIRESHLPIGITSIANCSPLQGLQFWWDSRLIPKNRKGYSTGKIELDNAINNSYGFNLSDQYWIKPEVSDLTWNKGNYYQNNFNEDIGNFITGSKSVNIHNMKTDSPDLFSNGEQDKRWCIKRGKRILIKYGRPPYFEQPFNEMLSTEICRRLNIPHVKYEFIIKNKKNPVIYSSCECFIDENTEFIPAGFIQYVLKRDKKTSTFDHLINCCKALEMSDIEGIKSFLYKMIFIDYIVGNVDRHFGNFGFIRNAETLQWLGPAPVFDTGNAMFFEYPTSDLRKGTGIMDNVICRSFAAKQSDCLKRFAKHIYSQSLDFSKLDGIKDYYMNILGQNPKDDEERSKLLSELLMIRIEKSKTVISGSNEYVMLFLSTIRDDNSMDAYIKKIARATQIVSSKSEKHKLALNEYISSLKASNPTELEEKIKKAVKKI